MTHFRTTSIAALFAAPLIAGLNASMADEIRFDPIRVSVVNATGADLYCQALAARWYAFELGNVARNASLQVDMAVDAKTKTVVIFNHRQRALPIETLFCGYSGREWETKFQFSLAGIAHAALGDRRISFACRDDNGKLACS